MAKLTTYLKFSRPFSLPTSLLSAVFGYSIGYWRWSVHGEAKSFDWLDFALLLIGVFLVHFSSNLANTFFDWKSGLDLKHGAEGANNAIVLGQLTAQEVDRGWKVSLVLAVFVGAYFIVTHLSESGYLIALVAVGGLSAYYYTAPPLALKYRGLGDFQVALTFGYLIVFGGFIVATPGRDILSELPDLSLLATPISLLFVSILHANNHRDRAVDRESQAWTIAVRLSERGSLMYQAFLVSTAYAIVAVCSFLGYAPQTWLATFLTIPLAVSSVRKLWLPKRYSQMDYARVTADSAIVLVFFAVISIIVFCVDR